MKKGSEPVVDDVARKLGDVAVSEVITGSGVVDITAPPYQCRAYSESDPATRDNMGDGTTWGFRKALADALAQNKVLYVPPGTFWLRYTSALSKLSVTGNLMLAGAGRSQSRLHLYADAPTVAFRAFETVNTPLTLEIRSLTLEGPELPAPEGVSPRGVSIPGGTSAQVLRMSNVAVSEKLYSAVSVDAGAVGSNGSVSVDIENCDLSTYGIAITVFGEPGAVKRLHVRHSRLANTTSHLVYVHPHVAIDFSGVRFENTPQWAIHHYSESGAATAAPEYARISDCSFVNVGRALLATDNGPTTITGCNLKASGPLYLRASAVISGCLFKVEGENNVAIASWRPPAQGIAYSVIGCHFDFSAATGLTSGLVADGSSVWHVSDCAFLANGSRALVFGINSGTEGAPTVIVDNCSANYLDGGSPGCGYVIVANLGQWTVSDCRFYGDFTQDRGAVAVNGGALLLTGCSIANFRGYALWFSGSGSFAGWGNRNLGQCFLQGGAWGALQLRPGVSPTPLVSAGSLTLAVSAFDTYHLAGTATIENIVLQTPSSHRAFGGARLRLVADGAWSLGSSGNILAKSGARAVNSVVELLNDPATGKWIEV